MRLRPLLPLLLLTLAAAGCREAPALPMLYPVPPAALIADSGEPFSTDSLRGQVVIWDFIFTRCGATCPMMTRSMQKLALELEDVEPLRFASVSVDPVYDTPEVLAAYAAQHRKDTRWVFLTGDRDEVLSLSVEGFKLAAGVPQDGLEPLLHSTKFVLVDATGTVRGYYESGDDEEMKNLAAHARALVRELER